MARGAAPALKSAGGDAQAAVREQALPRAAAQTRGTKPRGAGGRPAARRGCARANACEQPQGSAAPRARAAAMARSGLQRRAALALAAAALVLLSLNGAAAQNVTPSMNITVSQPQGIANVSLVTATAALFNPITGLGIPGQNITFGTVGATGAPAPALRRPSRRSRPPLVRALPNSACSARAWQRGRAPARRARGLQCAAGPASYTCDRRGRPMHALPN